MVYRHLIPALAAFSTVAAQSSGSACEPSGGSVTVNSASAITELTSCSSIKGDVIIDSGAGAQVDISGPKTISGKLIFLNNGVIINFNSDTLAEVGEISATNVTILSSFSTPALKKVNSLSFKAVPQLGLNFGTPGLSQVNSIEISDTGLDALTGINPTTATKIDINNNNRLVDISLPVHDLSDQLLISANGRQVNVQLPNLVWIANMTIANVTQFSAPRLSAVNGSARFDSNYVETLDFTNLTKTESGDLSFVGNSKLTALNVPNLKQLGGGLLVANNTQYNNITFPALATVLGAVKVRGSADVIAFPALNNFRGAVDISSTKDISKSCDALKEHAPSEAGGDNKILGVFTCVGKNANANSDTSSGSSGNGQVDGSSGGKNGTGNSAGGINVNHVLLGLVTAGGFAHALW